jgi:hypothetical protein
LKAGSVAAELLKTSITDWDRSSRAVKLKPHRILFHKGNSSLREREGNKLRQPMAHTSRAADRRRYARQHLDLPLSGIRTHLTMLHLWSRESIEDFTVDAV